MSESKVQSKTTSNVKITDEKKQKSGTTNSKNTCSQTGNHEMATRGETPRMSAYYYKTDANINSNNFNNGYRYPNAGYTQQIVRYNSHPSHYQPLQYQTNGTVYYQTTFRPFYYPSFQPSFRPPNQMTTKRKYSKSSDLETSEQMKERVLRFRQMIKCRSYGENESNEFRFSIMTYNILAQNLLEDHSSLYEHCDPSALSWPQRGHLILKELLESDSDIICLQEVHSKYFDDLLPALKQNGYNSVFKQRTGGKMDGCAVVYKENKFSLLNVIKLDFVRRELSSLLDRDNIALIVELKPMQWSEDSKLIVANTHLLYNPKRGDVKLAQIRLLMAEIHKIAQISEKEGIFDYNPILLCGDLNSEPNSLLYNFITKGLANFDGRKVGDISGQREGFGRGRRVENHHLKLMGVTSDTRFENSSDNQTEIEENMSLKHNFKLNSVIHKFEDKYGNKLISSSNRFGSALVDYIFYDYKKLKLRAFQRLMTENQLPQIGYIPNTVLGSDHLSFKAIFSII